ncbi:hypothetical protein E2562_005956 [Oryza meyeriana var. granulata]|uniref:Uncharacterized protein n=1 Tax=Oryza meyeriana var. granulata TaxID=110450 RepID=A0A6G1DV14_9ORYZ|nr:hypothetical protein E2562_005956 [Oryza meyeriana var. granulata]
MQPCRSVRVRELHDDDFNSGEEDEANGDEDIDFESHQDEVLPTKYYEQEDDVCFMMMISILEKKMRPMKMRILTLSLTRMRSFQLMIMDKRMKCLMIDVYFACCLA